MSSAFARAASAASSSRRAKEPGRIRSTVQGAFEHVLSAQISFLSFAAPADASLGPAFVDAVLLVQSAAASRRGRARVGVVAPPEASALDVVTTVRGPLGGGRAFGCPCCGYCVSNDGRRGTLGAADRSARRSSPCGCCARR